MVKWRGAKVVRLLEGQEKVQGMQVRMGLGGRQAGERGGRSLVDGLGTLVHLFRISEV